MFQLSGVYSTVDSKKLKYKVVLGLVQGGNFGADVRYKALRIESIL